MQNKTSISLLVLFCSCLLSIPNAFAGIVIDGVLDEQEWAGAQVYSDFVTVSH